MTRRDELLRTLEGITRTETYDAEARRILAGGASEAEIEAAYRRLACRYDAETERYTVCDGHHRCVCDRSDRLKRARERFAERAKARLEARKRLTAAIPPPRYDEVYERGLEALEACNESPTPGDSSELRDYALLLARATGGRL